MELNFIFVHKILIVMSPAPARPIDQNQINDLIGKPPSWILRSGISLIALFSLVIIILSHFISYPDKVSADGVMTAGDPPILHHSMSNGVLDTLFYADGQIVSKQTPIAYIQNPANREDVSFLRIVLKDLDSLVFTATIQIEALPGSLNLGSLQADYARLTLLYQEYGQACANEVPAIQFNAINQEINYLNQLKSVYHKDRELQHQEFELAQLDHQRQHSLWQAGVISTLDYERAKSALIHSEKIYNNTQQSIIQNSQRVNQLQQDLNRIQEERWQLLLGFQHRIREQLQHLLALIVLWEQQYYIYAQADGLLNWYPEVAQGRFIRSGDPLFTIVQSHQVEKFVRIYVPTQEMRSIATGTRSILKFHAYPYKQWGVVESRIRHISAVPIKDNDNRLLYEVQIALPDSMVTTYGLKILYKAQDGVWADLITEDRSILTRIFDHFLNLISNRVL
jgi:multidrug efflux pump subunit AcrA (membrane-fusion protein)